MGGLIFKKSLAWHVANTAILTAGFLGGMLMVVAISLVTFAMYIVTSAAHLLSLPGMAVLACALVLLARDELFDSWEAVVWQNIKVVGIKACIQGSFSHQSGWLIAEMNAPPDIAFLRYIARLSPRKKPIRVIKVVADDGEMFVVGWDIRPMPMHTDGNVLDHKGQSFRFGKQLFG